MKYLKAILSVIVGALSLEAPAQTPRHWVQDSSRQVYWIPDHMIELSLSEIEVDADNWAMLNISVGADHDLYSKQFQEISAAYPGYEIKRAFAEIGSDWTMTIPDLKHSQKLQPLQSADHIPYANVVLMVKRADYPKLREAIQKNPESVVSIEGLLKAALPKKQMVVDWISDSSICLELIRKGSGFYAVTEALTKVYEDIDEKASSPSVRKQAKRLVLSQCLKLRNRASIDSFADLMNLEFELNEEPGRLVVEHEISVVVNEQVPLRSQVKVSGKGAK